MMNIFEGVNERVKKLMEIKLKYQMKDRMKYFWREKRQREENASERRERK